MSTVEFTIKGGIIAISRHVDRELSDDVPEIFAIEDIRCDEDVDLSHIIDNKIRNNVKPLIDNYEPKKTRSIDITMRLILKDEEPVYHRPRRLSPADRETANQQVNDWLRDGIIQPSLSEYASPIVLVKKKGRNK